MEKFLTGLFIGLIGAVVVAVVLLVVGVLYAFPVMWIWNWMMPELFALPALSFWQAFWGTFLCGLLFKNTSVQTSK